MFPNTNTLQQFHNFTLELILESNEILLENFASITFEHKNTNDLVTKVDLEVEEFYRTRIQKQYPEHSFYGEENGGEVNSNGYTWLVDPLDGTNNYAIGIPVFGTAITLLHNNKVVISVISCPFVNKIYSGILEQGVFFNAQKYSKPTFQSSKRISILVGYDIVRDKITHSQYLNYKKQMSLTHSRIIESWCPVSDYILLLEGKIDKVVLNNNEFYDSLPGIFLAKELGLQVLDSNGLDYEYQGGLKISCSIEN